MVYASKVVRDDSKRATRVVIDTGNVQITYILDQRGQLKEIGRSSQDQILDDQSLIVSPVDLQKSKVMAGAILREKRRKAP
jgi:hypothetical protein